MKVGCRVPLQFGPYHFQDSPTTSKMAYVPPHQRPTEPGVVTQSHQEWLREQQSRATTTVKTPEQRRAELASLTFQQLRARAGPGPACDGFDFWTEQCNHTEAQGQAYAAQLNFSSELTNYRKYGSCPPPAPLDYTTTFADWAATGRHKAAAYEEWYNLWGKLLLTKWQSERRTAPPTPSRSHVMPTQRVRDPTPPPITRVIPTIPDKSGW